MLRLMLRSDVVMASRDAEAGVESIGARNQPAREENEGQGGPTLLMSSRLLHLTHDRD